ncbi:7204_t:CDS:1, partial [Diversispora eburnea]
PDLMIYNSIPYILPEILRGNEFTKKGDIYSFGGIMYEVATGNKPFAGQKHDIYI